MLQRITANKTGRYRKSVLHGQEYIVAPVRMIVAGVLTGNRGSLLYPPNEIRRSVSAWNGMPIVVDHPKEGSRYISARNPNVIDKVGVGFVFNANYSDDNLDAEAWIDIKKLKTVNRQLADRVLRDEQIEISTGLGTENEPNKGNFKRKQYDYIAKNYAPDHLALLPTDKGACSLNDGCGLNVNKSKISFVHADLQEMKNLVWSYNQSGTSRTFSSWSRITTVNKSCSCDNKCDDCQKQKKNFKKKNKTEFQSTINFED
jgi:hypothetical protein